MKEYVISDLHFGHKNIIKYENRPFENIEEMDKNLIEMWNNTANREDLIYILGDFSWYNGAKTNELLKNLNGRKILVIGNHDSNFLTKKDFDKSLFDEICNYKEVKINKKLICMSHYPIADWNGKENGSIHLFGHIHTIDNEAQKYMSELRLNGYNCFNVGYDIQKRLVELNEYL